MPKISLVVCLYKERDLLERLLHQAEGCYDDLVLEHEGGEEAVLAEDRMAESNEWRVKCGESARKHILSVADPKESTDRVEMAMRCAIEDRDNPLAEQDLEKATQTAEYLDKHQWGHSLEESLRLRGTDAKIRFLRWQRRLRNRFA